MEMETRYNSLEISMRFQIILLICRNSTILITRAFISLFTGTILRNNKLKDSVWRPYEHSQANQQLPGLELNFINLLCSGHFADSIVRCHLSTLQNNL